MQSSTLDLSPLGRKREERVRWIVNSYEIFVYGVSYVFSISAHGMLDYFFAFVQAFPTTNKYTLDTTI